MNKVCVGLILLTLLAILSGCVYPTFYAAEIVSKPHVVIADDVWLLSTEGTKLFLLPKSYYAEITSMDDYYYFVSFNGISGRVKKSEVTTVGYHAVAVGTQTEIKVDDVYAEFSALLLKKAPDLSSEDVTTIPISASFTFVGKYPVEDTMWYAVKWEQHFGYVKADRTNNPDIVIADFTPEQLPTPDTSEDNTSSGTDDSNNTNLPNNSGTNTVVGALTDLSSDGVTLKIVLIIGLIIPALIVILLVFRPLTRRRK